MPLSLPTSIWLPEPRDTPCPPPAPQVLPAWAIDRVRTEFTHRGAHGPAQLLRLSLDEVATMAAPGSSLHGTAEEPHGASVVLAELHPESLSAASVDAADGCEEHAKLDEGWPGFLHRVHRLLPAGGLLLLAARQRRDTDRLIDPLGLLISSARTAGFRYLQHIVVVHARPVADRLVPAPTGQAPTGLIHSDLLVLSAVRSTL